MARRIKTKRDLRREIEEDLALAKQYYLSFNEEGLQISAGDFTTDLSWRYFFARLETPTILLLFYKEGKYAFNAFTASEIGSGNLDRLKALAKEKLPLLSERIHLKDRIKKQQ
ncbi:hypothetical protein HRG84_19675 [Flavisolibacter sp. BT320]|nr:hypothetical protein [Flavisolibacter longurius]